MRSETQARVRIQPHTRTRPHPPPHTPTHTCACPQVGAEFAPQEVANTLWALARFGAKPSAPVMAEFFSATDRRLSSFKPQELSSMVWALAKVRAGRAGCVCFAGKVEAWAGLGGAGCADCAHVQQWIALMCNSVKIGPAGEWLCEGAHERTGA